MIEVRNLAKRYGPVTAIDGLTLCAARHSFCFMGAFLLTPYRGTDVRLWAWLG